MTDIRTCLRDGAARLSATGIDNPWREARLLLSHATGLGEATLVGYPERTLDDCGDYVGLIERRAAREPVSHLIGRREFWSLPFEVTADTLDPRPDSETLVGAARDALPDARAALRIADLGTGTGCLLAALLSEYPNARGIGVERDPAAARVAARNLRRLGLSDRAAIAVSNWDAALDGAFDLIVSNPPYIPTAAIAALQPEIARFEPALALDGGPDGLAALRRVLAAMAVRLARGGIGAVEFGDGQEAAVRSIARSEGLEGASARRDLGGKARCLVCRRPG